MRRLRSKQITIALIIILMLFTNNSFAVETTSSRTRKIEDLKTIIDYIHRYYLEEVTDEQLFEGAYKGLFNTLDPYSNYLNPDEFRSLTTEIAESFGGVGIQLGIRDGKIIVIAPIIGAPAHRAGIKAGDEIVSVDNTNVRGMNFDRAINMILGKPGTKVILGIQRNEHKEVLYFEIVRELISVNSAQAYLISENIGYIALGQFNQKSGETVAKALEEFAGQNIKGIILDLRNNPGGLLEEAVNVAELFVPKGPIVHIEYKNKKIQSFYSETPKLGIPLAVLVNEGSASASEIVAGAIQDTKSGTIIGTKTFGKGTVQNLLPLNSGGAIKLTVANYMTPSKKKINGIGITPDIIIENHQKKDLENPDKLDDKALEALVQSYDDLQLKKAIEVIMAHYPN